MLFAIPFPAIDPVAIEIGPLTVRWYALAYIAGLLLGWQYVRQLAKRGLSAMKPVETDDLMVWATVGVIGGGRLGYVLFYNFAYYFENPLEIVQLWHGGMSFHGGVLGVVLALYLFARRRGLPPLMVGDSVCAAVPIGLFFGRVANFINGELFGRASDVPWAMAFPNGGPEPRHPSQLYEAGLEGLVLFLVLLVLVRGRAIERRPGLVSGVFLAGYGLARLIVELFREPDAHIGFFAGGVTMGQMLSLPMLALGVWLAVRAKRVT